MKWLAKERFNNIDVAGILVMTHFLRSDSYLAALLTLIATNVISAAAIVFSKMGEKA